MIDKLLSPSEAVNRGGLVLLGRLKEEFKMFLIYCYNKSAVHSLIGIKIVNRSTHGNIISYPALILVM